MPKHGTGDFTPQEAEERIECAMQGGLIIPPFANRLDEDNIEACVNPEEGCTRKRGAEYRGTGELRFVLELQAIVTAMGGACY